VGVKKTNHSIAMFFLILGIATLTGFGFSKAYGEEEIDLNEALAPTPTPVPQKVVPAVAVEKNTTAAPAAKTDESNEITMEGEATEEAEPTATPVVAQGVLKAKHVYEAGIKAYKEKDYDLAVRYLKKAVSMKDPYTPKYIYAEANAMLGVIYQFHIIHKGRAYRYYQAALVLDKENETARKHKREVYRYRHRKD
jgi:tetratricopeptide (TPR) repeat protein